MQRQDSQGLEQVRAYHERTKHRLDRYAAGPDFLDWDQQPDPFRRYAGAPLIPLPLDFDRLPDPGLHELSPPPMPIPLGDWGLSEISCLFRHSLGLAAWKVYGPDRWALRCNPSSGNLHPTEGYLAVRGLAGLSDGVYHYAPHEHALEHRAEFPADAAAGEASAGPVLLLGLSSIAWREAWKYGERAYRYVHLDLGHAIGAFAYAAAILGLRLRRVDADETQLAALLGLDREEDFGTAERERPDLLLQLVDDPQTAEPSVPLQPWLALVADARWSGRANTLSRHPRHQWPILDQVAQATPSSAEPDRLPGGAIAWPAPETVPGSSARRLILQRRSAQAFSGKASLPREAFFRLLDPLLPRPDQVPWNSWPVPARIDLALFVHRVDDLPPGLYLLARDPQRVSSLKAGMNPEFVWQPVAGCPDHLPLFLLLEADAKRAARTLSCHQDIAASGFFSLGMLAEFERTLQERGPRGYPELYWEAGLIGHALYLQAEAAGVRGTGIGCFFDDAVHEILGLGDSRWQSLYHFTVGQPKPDDRLQTLPPYDHLDRS